MQNSYGRLIKYKSKSKSKNKNKSKSKKKKKKITKKLSLIDK